MGLRKRRVSKRRQELLKNVETPEYHQSYKKIKQVQMMSTVTSLAGLALALFSFEIDLAYHT